MTAAQYRMTSPAGAERETGSADVEVTGGALVLTPGAGPVLRVPFAQIAAVSEPEPFTILVTLPDGSAISLSRLGVMRTQLLAELRDGLAGHASAAAGALGPAETFSGLSGGEPAEIRVHDDAMLIIGPAGSERVSFSFAEAVRIQDYVVTVTVAGGPEVTLSRLGRQAGELAALLQARLAQARGRTAAFLGSLLPGLDPMALREAAGLLRDGVAVPAGDLDRVHPELSSTLTRIAALPARRDAIAALAGAPGLALGFKQVVSVRRPATGVTPWHDHAVAPHIGEHASPGGAFRPGMAGMFAAGVMEGGPSGGADYWAFRALGLGLNGRPQRPMASRPDLTRGRLTPATQDLAALTVTGEDPTVLAFALAARGDRVVYEVLNQPEPVTYVYRGELTAVNRALDDAGFQAGAVKAEDTFFHNEQWFNRIGTLLGTR